MYFANKHYYFNRIDSICFRGTVGQSVRRACGKSCVRIPAATNLSRKNSDSSNAKHSATGMSVTGPRKLPV